jgi:PAS domain S-box-containing protein
MPQGPLVTPAQRQQQTAAMLRTKLFAEEASRDLDRVSRIACRLFACETAFLGFLDGDRIIIKGGPHLEATPSMESHRVPLPIEAFIWDDDFPGNPLIDLIRSIVPGGVSGGIVPISVGPDATVGIFCVVSENERRFTEADIPELTDFAELVSSGVAAYVSEFEVRQAHRARSESERRLTALLHAFPDPIFRLTRHGVYRDVHAPDAAILVASDLKGKRLHDVLEPQLADELCNVIQLALDRQELECVEYELETEGRGLRHFEARVMPCADDEVVFTVRDITDRKEAALHLAARESLLDSVMRATIILLTRPSLSVAVRDAFALLGRAVDVDRVYFFENHHDANGRLLCSQRFEWARDQVEAQIDNPDLQDLDYQQAFPEWLTSLAEGHPVAMIVSEVDAAIRASLVDQEIRSLLLVPIMQNGDFIGFVGFDDCRQDRRWSETELSVLMTAAAGLGGAIVQRKSRFELGNSRARYKALVDNVNDIIFQTDETGTILFANPSWEHVTGCPVSAVVGERLHAFVAPDDVSVIDRCIHALRFQQAAECRHDVRLGCEGGTTRWVQLYARASHDEQGNVIGLFGTLHDVTERRLYEDALVSAKDRAEEMAMLKSSFLANMSHEIRTPLTSILGFSQILMEELAGDQREMIDLIVRNGNRLMDTLNSVLELARLESEDVRLNIKPIRIDREVEEIVRLFSHRTFNSNVELRYEVEGAVTCHTDASILRRILDNLVGNALKFTSSGEVVISAAAAGERVAISVRDTGIGIEEAFLTSLFEDFTQESSGLDRQFEGAGLGLSITRRLVELIGAEITVESTKGVGSTFAVIVPRRPQLTLLNTADPVASGAIGGRRPK